MTIGFLGMTLLVPGLGHTPPIPEAPANLAITDAFAGLVPTRKPEATWDASDGAVTYAYQRSTSVDFTTGVTEIDDLEVTNYTPPDDLLNFTDYYFRVAGVNLFGQQGDWSEAVTVQTAHLAFHDPFSTDYASPIPDPLNGKWDVYDSVPNAQVDSSRLGWDTSAASGNPQFVTNQNLEAMLNVEGACIAFRWRTQGGRTLVGIGNSTSAGAGGSNIQSPSIDLNNIGNLNIGGRSIFHIPFAQDNTEYWTFITRRPTGYHFHIYGGGYANGQLMFTITEQAAIIALLTASLVMRTINTGSNFDFNDVAVAHLPPPFTDTGLAESYQASSLANDQIAMSTNAMVEWRFVAETGVTRRLYVRYVDATHYIALKCDQGAGTFAIVKNEGSGESILNSVAWTWTNGTTYRVLAYLNGAAVDAQASTGSEWATVSNPAPYTPSAPLNGGTLARVSHDGGIFASWPLVRSDVKTIFDRYINAMA